MGDSFKVGLGLWKYPVMSLVAEIAALFGGMYVYMRATKAVTPGGRYAMFILGLVMLAIHISLFFWAAAALYAVRSDCWTGLLCGFHGVRLLIRQETCERSARPGQ